VGYASGYRALGLLKVTFGVTYPRPRLKLPKRSWDIRGMYNSETKREIIVGLAVVLAAVLGLFLIYSPKIGLRSGYELRVHLDRADGISRRTDVKLAGVKIGSVSQLDLDTRTYAADVKINIDNNIKIPTDSTLKVISAPILGDAYISIEPGKANTFLPRGGLILKSVGAIDLMDYIGKQGLEK